MDAAIFVVFRLRCPRSLYRRISATLSRVHQKLTNGNFVIWVMKKFNVGSILECTIRILGTLIRVCTRAKEQLVAGEADVVMIRGSMSQAECYG